MQFINPGAISALSEISAQSHCARLFATSPISHIDYFPPTLHPSINPYDMPQSKPTKQAPVRKPTPPVLRASTSRKWQASNADEIQNKRTKPDDNDDEVSSREVGKEMGPKKGGRKQRKQPR